MNSWSGTLLRSLPGPHAAPKGEMPTHEQLNSPTTKSVLPSEPSGHSSVFFGMKSPVHSSGSGSLPRPSAGMHSGMSLLMNCSSRLT